MDVLAKELEMIARVVTAEDLRGLEDGDEGSRGVYYRGCSVGEALGSVRAFPIWLTDVLEYAKEYADDDIRMLESSLDTEMEQVKAKFESSREQIIDKLFRIVVGLDEQ